MAHRVRRGKVSFPEVENLATEGSAKKVLVTAAFH